MKNYNQIAGFSKQRLDALSDGVFAIALTLLVLDVKVPLGEMIHSEAGLLKEIGTIAPSLLTYFMSFLTLGVYWVAHSSQYYYINKSDRDLTWISLFFLLFVSVIPFTTAFISEFIEFKLAIWLYWLNLILLGVMLAINWMYVNRKNYLNIEGKERQETNNAIKWRFIEAHASYTIAVLVSFINTYLSIVLLIFVLLNFAFGVFTLRGNQKSL